MKYGAHLMQPAFCLCVLMKLLVSHSGLTLLTCIWNKRNVCFPRLKNLGVSWHCIEITPTCFFYLNKTMNSFWKYKISFLDSVTHFPMVMSPLTSWHLDGSSIQNTMTSAVTHCFKSSWEPLRGGCASTGSTVQPSTLLTWDTDTTQRMRS